MRFYVIVASARQVDFKGRRGASREQPGVLQGVEAELPTDGVEGRMLAHRRRFRYPLIGGIFFGMCHTRPAPVLAGEHTAGKIDLRQWHRRRRASAGRTVFLPWIFP